MSGGPKGAKRPLERPLDGGVRCLLEQATEFALPMATLLGGDEHRLGGHIAARSQSVPGESIRADACGGG